MLEKTARDYAAYLKLDVSSELSSVQEVVDNMLTRLEELTSVLQMVKSKNSECSASVAEDIIKYRSEVTTLSKKINTLTDVMMRVHLNVDTLEKQVEKAETDFGVSNDNRIKSFLKPFLMRVKEPTMLDSSTIPGTVPFQSVMNHFHDSIDN